MRVCKALAHAAACALARRVDRASDRVYEPDGLQRAAERIECELLLVEVDGMIELDVCGVVPAQL